MADPIKDMAEYYMKLASDAARKGDAQMAGYYAQKAVQVAKGPPKAPSAKGISSKPKTSIGASEGPYVKKDVLGGIKGGIKGGYKWPKPKYSLAKGGTLKKGKAAGKPVSKGASRGKSKK